MNYLPLPGEWGLNNIIIMQKIVDNLVKYSLVILFFSLPIVNSHFFDLLWIKSGFYVNWNYEFTKVMFFNIFLWIIFVFFIIQKLIEKILYKKKYQNIIIPKILYLLIWIILISTFFSDFFYTSLLWNASKSHGMIMFINLIWMFVIFINSSKKFKKQLIKTSLLSLFFVTIIWIKEYYYPTFDYWDLSNRAFSTFWHPNYLALFILILVPFLIDKIKQNYIYLILFILSVFCLFLTKSAWWIIIFLIYFIFLKIPSIPSPLRRGLGWGFIILLILFFSKFWLTTKLHSFLSRFFIWETTIKIIFSDIKNIVVWAGLWTLSYIFDSFKSSYLYIFENFWFTADRPHNLLLNIFYHFWILWLFFIVNLFIKIFKYYKISENKYKIYYESIFLFLLFTIFNFASISHYLIIILVWSFIYNKSKGNSKYKLSKYFSIISIIIVSIFWVYFNTKYYIEEHKLYTNSSYISNNILYNKIKSENYEQNLFWNNFTNIQDMCQDLILYSNSVENNFYCWNLLWEIDKNLSKEYYKKWLNKTPDLWNTDSKYNNNFLIKNFVDKKRFYSKKYSDLEEILKRSWIKIN